MKNSTARTLDPQTLPPPAGANDVYSAQTRLGSLPEDVLAAMRDEEDARYLRRTQSGTQRAIRPPPLPLAPVTARSVDPQRPETPEPFSSVRPRSLPPAVSEAEVLSDLDMLAEASMPATESYEIVVEDASEARAGLARSIAIVALFAVLGGLAACAIMLLD